MLLIGFIGQLAVAKVWTEPYPGLFQPGFGGFGGKQGAPENMTTVPQSVVTASYADGSTATFVDWVVMEQSKSAPSAVFQSAFGAHRTRPFDPRTVAWLERRLADLHDGRRPVRAVISWRDVVHDIDTGQPLRITTTDELVVPLRNGGGNG